MPALITPYRSVQPVLGRNDLAWGHPSTRGLVGYYALNERGGNVSRDLSRTRAPGTFGAYPGAPKPYFAEGGVVFDPPTGSNTTYQYINVSTPPLLAGLPKFTFICSGTFTFGAYGADGGAIYCERNASTPILKINQGGGTGGGNQLAFVYRDNAGTLNAFTSNGLITGNGTTGNTVAQTWIAVVKRGTQGILEFWINGAFDSANTITASDTISAANCWIGADSYDPLSYFIGTLRNVKLFNHDLSAPELVEEYARPYRQIVPSTRRMWFGSSTTTLVNASDGGTLIDSASVAAALGYADASTFTDVVNVSANITTIDTATVVDSATLAAFLSLADSATLLDLAGLTAALTSLDAAGLIDTPTVSATLSAVDSAGLTEVSVLALMLSAFDSASLTDFPTVSAILGAIDSVGLSDSAAALATDQFFAVTDAIGLTEKTQLNKNIPTFIVGYASILAGMPDSRFSRIRQL